MGMSASQARLLSITARLSDNELRSQSITTAKMSLANKTTDASREYINALNETQLLYTTYDNDGNKMLEKLTGTSLTNYGILKNQYGIINPDGQIMVSELDAKNYTDSANIAEFLEKYGFENAFEEVTKTELNEGEYNAAISNWRDQYSDWREKEPPRIIEHEKSPAWTETIPEYTERIHSSELYYKVMRTECIGQAVSNTNCYMHVLVSLLGEGNYTTSDGIPFQIFKGNCGEHDKTWCWNTDQHPVSDDLKNELANKYPCGEVHDQTVDLKYGGKIYKVWCRDTDCNQNISVKQKIIDLLWKVHGDYTIGSNTGGSADPSHIAEFWHIIEFDLDEATEVYHPEQTIDHPAVIEKIDNPAYAEWVESEPEKPDMNNFMHDVTYLQRSQESEEGQWYINLWHRMNGASIYKTTINGVDNGVHDSKDDGVIEGDNISSPTNGLTKNGKVLWTVLEDGLMNSSEWLKYALENGYVSLERVNYSEPTESGTGIENYTWTSIIYTNAADIKEQENERKITQAEVNYQQTVRDIESKDKQYDNILKRLDTEHSALQTEFDSIKSVIKKNTERTLKMYS